MNLTNPGPALTLDEIEAFEQEIGGRLPDDYKRFLLTSNGGMAEPEVGFRWNNTVHEVPSFYRLLPTPDNGLRRGLSNLREFNIDGFLPIASNFDEQQICVAFLENVGEVSWAMFAYDDDIPVDATMVPLASSFTEFLNSLFVLPILYCPVVELGEHGTLADLTDYLAGGNSIDAVGKHGSTIVGEAIKFNNLPIIRACIERGASLSETIRLAVGNRRPELIEMLVDAGADVNEQNEFGSRPLKYVGGTALPGEEGAANRAMRDLLLKLGAIE